MRIGINAQLLSFEATYRQAGLSRHIYELLMQVPGHAPRVHFTAYIPPGNIPETFSHAAPPNLRLSAGTLPTGRAPVRIAWEQTALSVDVMRDRLDLLHCPVNVRPLVCFAPTVLTIHDLIFLRYPQSFHSAKRRYLSAMTGWSARHAAHVITVSEATRRDVIDLLRVAPERVTTVYNGVGIQFKPLPSDQTDEFRRKKGLEGPVLLYVGTLEPRKNLPVLLRAFHSIADEPGIEDATLVIGGSKGWYYNEIFSTADSLGLASSGRVRFLGRVPDEELPLWYNIATACVYPSLYEGFGLPPLEAMACGTPVITANTSSLPEVVGEAGLMLEPDDIAGWAEAIRSIITNAGLRSRLSEEARNQARSFTWERMAHETVAVYRQVLDKRLIK